jgi:hypothetical protein
MEVRQAESREESRELGAEKSTEVTSSRDDVGKTSELGTGHRETEDSKRQGELDHLGTPAHRLQPTGSRARHRHSQLNPAVRKRDAELDSRIDMAKSRKEV